MAGYHSPWWSVSPDGRKGPKSPWGVSFAAIGGCRLSAVYKAGLLGTEVWHVLMRDAQFCMQPTRLNEDLMDNI